MKTMMPVQPQPPVSFLAPYPAATPRSSLLISSPWKNDQVAARTQITAGSLESHESYLHNGEERAGTLLLEHRTETPCMGTA
jgi:hypothetical protein